MKKLISTFLALCLLLPALYSCSENETAQKGGDLKLWFAPSFVKVFQDTDYSAEENFIGYYNSNSLSLSMFKNEFEGAQVIITAKEDIEKYDISVSDLTLSGDDSAKLPKENIAIYNQKYIEVSFPSEAHSVSLLGMIPDALLPFETAKKYSENRVANGNNQGIWLDFRTQENQQAGEYTGAFTLTADGKSYNVPVSLTVWDYAVPSATTLQTSFLLRHQELMETELDSSFEMYEKYYEKLLDYRISATNMPLLSNKSTKENDDFYVEQIKKYSLDERVSAFNLPNLMNSNYTDYDYVRAEYWFQRLAEESFAAGYNLFEKAVDYIGFLDEPHITKTEHLVAPTMKKIAKVRRKVIKYLNENKDSYDIGQTLFLQVIENIENFEFIITTPYREDFVYENNKSNPEDPEESYKIAWCPVFSGYNSETNRENYKQEGINEWWYGCNWPGPPYPTYHIDDDIVSSRIASWMQFNYNVVGNLYWRVNYALHKNSFGQTEALENMYETAQRNIKTNGEGFIVYPGKPYGLDNFVSTIRLESIRDGIEEYEILKKFEEKFNSTAQQAGYVNLDVNSVLKPIYDTLYKDARLTGSAQEFASARQKLAMFAVIADKGTIITEVESKHASTLVKVFVAQGKITVDGQEPQYAPKGSGKEYSIEIMQNKDINTLAFKLEIGANSYNFAMEIGGKKTNFPLSGISFAPAPTQTNTVTAEVNDDEGITLTLGASGIEQRVYLESADFAKMIKSGATSINVLIENPSDTDLEFVVKYIGTKNVILRSFETVILKAGSTTMVELNTSTFDWSILGAMKDMRFFVGKTNDPSPQRTIIIKSISITY